jgi:hypothetical protein
MKGILAAAAIASNSLPNQAQGSGATAALKRAEAAMGGSGLRTLRNEGAGSVCQIGQANGPGL